MNNGKGFAKISKPTERNGAYHLQFDFPHLFSADERLETGKLANGKEIPFRRKKRSTSEGVRVWHVYLSSIRFLSNDEN